MRENCFSAPIEKEYAADVMILGGGVAGCAAAIAAARAGKDTLLVEASGTLGGMATAGHVSPLSAIEALDGRSFGGIMLEIVELLRGMNKLYGESDNDDIVKPRYPSHSFAQAGQGERREIAFSRLPRFCQR